MTLSTPGTGHLPSARYTGPMTPANKKLMQDAEEARGKLRRGLISYEEARAIVAKYAEAYNTAAIRIGKEYGVNPKKMSITAFMR